MSAKQIKKNNAYNYAKKWNKTYTNKVMSYSEKLYWKEFFLQLAGKCGLKRDKEFFLCLTALY